MMLNRIIDWFRSEDSRGSDLDARLAAAVLMLEVVRADEKTDPAETDEVLKILQLEFGLDDHERDQVLEAAGTLVEEANDLFRFTDCLNDQFSTEEKYQFVVSLWRVALADNEIDRYEDHTIRKINELLYLHHSHFIKAKTEVISEGEKR